MSDCLAENDVVDLLDGRLAQSEVERVTAHLDACDACRELVADAAREMPSSSPSGASTATRGTCIGRYVVIDRIGVGAMGVVYAAYDPELDRRVALKLLRADASRARAIRRRSAFDSSARRARSRSSLTRT